MKVIWDYFIPLFFAGLAAITFFGDPNERILFSIPIVPGEHKNAYTVGFLLASIFLAYSVFRSKNKESRDRDS